MHGGSWHCTGGSGQDHPQEKEMQKTKWLSEEDLQIAVKRREVKSKGEKERHTHLNAEFQRIARSDKKSFLSDQCKEIEDKNRMGVSRVSSRKLEIPEDHFMTEWAPSNDCGQHLSPGVSYLPPASPKGSPILVIGSGLWSIQTSATEPDSEHDILIEPLKCGVSVSYGSLALPNLSATTFQIQTFGGSYSWCRNAPPPCPHTHPVLGIWYTAQITCFLGRTSMVIIVFHLWVSDIWVCVLPTLQYGLSFPSCHVSFFVSLVVENLFCLSSGHCHRWCCKHVLTIQSSGTLTLCSVKSLGMTS